MADKYISQLTPLGSSTTYLLKDKKAIENITRSGTTFTATRRDGTTFTFTQQDNNSDTLVKQTAKSDNKNYKILTTVSDSPTSGNAAETGYDTGITINPSSHTLQTGRYFHNVVSFGSTTTPKEILIKTKIPFANGSEMPKIIFHMYNYGSGYPTELGLVFYVYNGAFCNYGVTSNTLHRPIVTLSSYTENNNKYVAIGLGLIGTADYPDAYFVRFNVDVLDIWADRNFCNGWTVEQNTSTTSIIPTDNRKVIDYRDSAYRINNSLTIKLKSGSTEGTDLYTFNGSASKTLDIKQGTGITLTAAAGSLTIANAGVIGVKGNAESSYRTGNVNLTLANLINTTAIGSTTQPVYYNGTALTATSYSLSSSVSSGTANRMAYYSGNNTISAASNHYVSNTQVGINTTTIPTTPANTSMFVSGSVVVGSAISDTSVTDGHIYLKGAGGKLVGMIMSVGRDNMDIGWNWGSRDGSGAAFRSTAQGGTFIFFARNASHTTQLTGSPAGSLVWAPADGTPTPILAVNSPRAGDGFQLQNSGVVYGSWLVSTKGVAPTATTTDGTTTYSGAVTGTSILTLGNNRVSGNSASGVADNAQGVLRMYNTGSGYSQMSAYGTWNHADTGLSLPSNRIGVMFRPESSSYYTHFSYETTGNEALVAATQNSVTSFIFVNGESYANVASDRWTKLTGASGAGNAPGLQIKQNCVSIGELIPNGTNATYRLNVKGNAYLNGNTIISGTLAKSNYRIIDNLASFIKQGNSTGTIKITLPFDIAKYDMPIFNIYLYEYNGYAASNIIIGGHNWPSGSTHKWYNTGYSITGAYDKGIRLANDGTNWCILLGTTTTTWNYVSLHLKHIFTEYDNNSSLWATGIYTITQITDEASIKEIDTPVLKTLFPLKNGTGASGTWGISITGNAATATKLASTGTTGQFWRGDNTWSNTLLGPLKIGNTDATSTSGYATANVGINNYIAFYGVYGDNPGSYNHTYIGERIWGPKTTANEQSELLLFHGNDPNASSGPDRIRTFSGAFKVDVFTTATYGDWMTVGESANAIQGLYIHGSDGIILGNTTARSNGINQTTINGHLVINGNYNTNNSYSEGIRINKSSNNWSVIQLGGATGTTTGTGDGQYLIGVNPNGYLYLSHNGSDGAAARIQGHKGNGWSVRPYLYINTDAGTSYNFYVNGSSYFNGNTTHNGIDYFANGTTYYINNSADGKLRYLALGGLDPTSSYQLYVNGTSWIKGNLWVRHLYPEANNAYDLGSSSYKWRDFYLSNTATIGQNIIRNNTSAPGQGDTVLTALGYKTGYPIYTDPTFLSGTNSVSVYNNSGGGTVTITRDTYSNYGIASPGTNSNYVLKITSAGTASPGIGGFVLGISSRANAQFIQIFRALIPVGRNVTTASNSMGTTYQDQWLTSTAGTGKWEWYARRVICGQAGSFSSGGHVYLDGAATTASAPFTWYLGYCNVYDLTRADYDGLRTRYADYTGTGQKVATGAASRLAYYSNTDTVSSSSITSDGTNITMPTASLITTGSGDGTHRGLKIGNTYIGAIGGNLIFQNNGAIRFGSTDSWDYNHWAGLKYVHSSKTIALGLADGTQFTANSAQSGGTLLFPGIRYLSINGKTAIDANDAWLRINEGKAFSSGVYFGSNIVRTDGQLQVGSSGTNFYANSSGNGYFSNTLGIAGTNTSYKLYVNGTSYFNGNTTHNGIDYFANGATYYINNSADAKLRYLALGGLDPTSSYQLYVNGTSWIKGTLWTRHLYPENDNTYDLGSSSYRWKNIYIVGSTRRTSRIYPYIASNERSQWYKIIFPYSTISNSSNNWFMLSFDLHFGGGYSSNPAGTAHVVFYYLKNNSNSWDLKQGSAFMTGILMDKITLYYRTAEPGILYVNNTSNQYNGIWMDNLYCDDTAPGYDFTTTKIETCTAITSSTNPALSAYTILPTVRFYANNGSTGYTTNNLLPSSNNSLNLGSSDNKWANIYTTTIHGALIGNADTATKLSNTPNNTTTFLRGDNTWSNTLKQTANTTLGIDSNLKIGTARKDLNFDITNGTGTGINDGYAGGITWGKGAAAYAGIYYQTSGSYGSRLLFGTTNSYANGAYARMIITHTGDIGINTLSPSAKLHVNGTSYFNGTLTVNNTIQSAYVDGTAASFRHLDAGKHSVSTDHNLYIGYGSRTYTSNIYFYTSTGSTDSVSGRTAWMDINSNGAYARTRFGVNGQNTSYNLYVNGSSYFTNQLLIQNNSTGRGDSYSGGIQLREFGQQTTSCTQNLYNAPGITFHWGGRWVHKLNLQNNLLNWDNNAIPNTGNISGTVGTATRPVYVNAGTITQGSYELKATVNAGTATRLAYYSGNNAISSASNIQYIPAQAAELGTTKGNVNGLFIYGTAYGNTAENLGSNTVNVFRYGDPGPQIRFSTGLGTSNAGASESSAIIWSDHSSSIGTDQSFHFVGQNDASHTASNVGIVTNTFIGKTRLTVGQNYANTSYNLYVRGIANFNIGSDNSYGIGGHRLNAIFAGTNHASILIATPTNNHAYGIAVNSNGNMYIGYRNTGSYTSSSGDTYSLILNKTASFYPATTNTTDLGTSSNFWKTGYIQGGVYIKYTASTDHNLIALSGAPNYGIRYKEGSPDTLKLSASNNANSDSADLCINAHGDGTLATRNNRIPHTGNTTGTVGTATKPVYVDAGQIKASASTVGTSEKPVYLNAGTITPLNPVWLLAGGTATVNNEDLNAAKYKAIGNYYSDGDAKSKTILNSPFGATASTSCLSFTLKTEASLGVGTTYLRQWWRGYNSGVEAERTSTNSGSSWSTWRTKVFKNSNAATAEGGPNVPVYITANGQATAISANSVLTNLASTTAASTYAASPRPGVTGTLGTANGGTGNTSFTASRLIYSNTATKLASGNIVSEGNYISNVTYLTINANHQTNSRFFVNGASYFQGTVFICPSSRYKVICFQETGTDETTRVAAFRYDAVNATNIGAGRFQFFEYSPHSTNDTTNTGFYELYRLPAVTAGLTANATYEILTTKNYTSYVPNISNVTNIKSTAATNATKYYLLGQDAAGNKPVYIATANSSGSSNTTGVYFQGSTGVLRGAAWNDYAEYRKAKEKDIKPGKVVYENGDDTLSITNERLQRGCSIVSDTFGIGIGESFEQELPIAVAGRVLAYPYESREEFREHIGWPVCSGPNGTVSIMTEEEEMKYPSRIIGTISAVPDYEIWHGGADVIVDGRVWIKVK